MTLARRLRVAGIFLISAGILSSCATTTLQSVWRAPDLNVASVHKVLIICVTSTPGLRDLVEGEFVRQWKSFNVQASASVNVLPKDLTLDKAGIAPFAKTEGYDRVMVTRLLKREQIEAQTPEDANLTQDVKAVVASPEYGMNFELAIVSATLYDVATEKRVWSGVTHTLVTGEAPARVRAYVKLILKNLYHPH